MKKLIPLRRVFGVASCAFALFAASSLSSGASAAPVGGGNQCLKDAFEYCGEFDSNTPEFFACVAHYQATYCP